MFDKPTEKRFLNISFGKWAHYKARRTTGQKRRTRRFPSLVTAVSFQNIKSFGVSAFVPHFPGKQDRKPRPQMLESIRTSQRNV